MRAGIAANHAGLSLKKRLIKVAREPGYEVLDFDTRTSDCAHKGNNERYVVMIAGMINSVMSDDFAVRPRRHMQLGDSHRGECETTLGRISA